MAERFEVAHGAIGELFWNINDGVLVCRPGLVMAWNPKAEAMLGLALEQPPAHDEDLRPFLGKATEQLWKLVEAGTGTVCLECTGGSERAVEASAWHLGGDKSQPVVVVFRDVTGEQRQMRGLQHLNVLARELLAERSLDVLLVKIVDAAKDLTKADFSALLLLREGSEAEVAHFVYNAPRELFPNRLPRAVGLLAAPIQSRDVARIDDIRGHPAGVGIPVEHPPIAALLAAPVFLDDEVVGELAVANQPERPTFDSIDEAMITELAAHAALALSLATARGAQEQIQATRRALLDVALHNIRTPLTVAQGFLSTVRAHGSQLSDEERERSFEAIERAHERIRNLAEGALLEEPVSPSTPPHEMEPIDVAELLQELQVDLAEARDDVPLEVAMATDGPRDFLGDRRLVRELLDNLVTNAVKHSPPGEPVTVTAREEGGSVRFDVTDRGPGIPPEEQGRIFEQFYRTGQSVAEGVPGTGLGLWIVRRLAELQGGTVGLSSRAGQGTTFWATFPLEPATRVDVTPA